MRLPRFKTPDRPTYYHLRARLAGPRNWYPLQNPRVAQFIWTQLQKFVQFYFCDLVGWAILGNHFHLILRFQAYRRLSRRFLQRRARAYYPRPLDRPQTARDWKKFNRRLFDVSEFMRNLNGAIATWYNHSFERRGSLFADRFQSSILESLQDVLNCLFYLDLNASRAGLVQTPEQWPWGSARQRLLEDDHQLLPLTKLLPGRSLQQCRAEYRWRLYWRGAIGGKPGRAQIPDSIIQAELARGVEAGKDRQRQPWFSRGVVIGSFNTVTQWLDQLHRLLLYRRPHTPIAQLGGTCFTLRPQRIRHWDQAATNAGPG